MAMEIINEGDEFQAMSPLSQYFNTSKICVSVLAVLELESSITPFEISSIIPHLFLSANPRFASIMIKGKFGERKWKKVEVNPEDHIYHPTLPNEQSYDTHFDEYLTKIAVKQFSPYIPLWEVHIFNYPTSNALCTLIFRIHHSIADGYSIMSLFLSLLKRADNPSLPLTFPSRQRSKKPKNIAKNKNVFSSIPNLLSSICSNVTNIGWTLMKSTLIEDDPTPIKPIDDCLELVKPISVSTMTFSLHQIIQIKNMLNVTVNDVLMGIIFLGIRMYMQEISFHSSQSNSSALVLLNTRMGSSYKSVQDLLKTNQWGNRIAFLPIPIPKLMETSPLEFIREAKENIMMQKKSPSVFIAASMFEMLKHFMDIEIGARFFKKKLKNSSIMVSNMIGPVEKMSLLNHNVKGLYFTVPGMPQSLLITIVSYMEDLRIVIGAEKCFIDQQKLRSCIEDAFHKILKSTLEVSTSPSFSSKILKDFESKVI